MHRRIAPAGGFTKNMRQDKQDETERIMRLTLNKAFLQGRGACPPSQFVF